MSSHDKGKMLTRSGSKALKQSLINVEVDDTIAAMGITALIGYEAENNHCIGLCTGTRNDYHFQLALARTDSYTYRTRSKHRLLYACMKGNVEWFQTLWSAGSVDDMIDLQYQEENLVYYLLDKAQEDGRRPHPDTVHRLAILRRLLATPISFTNIGQTTAIDNRTVFFGPLNLAIVRKNYALANELLKHPNRIDPNKPDEYPPILAASICKFWEIGIQLAAIPTVNLGAISWQHYSAVQSTVIVNKRSFIERVLLPHQDRIDINYMHENDSVGTALHFAVKAGCEAIIPVLVSFRNIDINVMHPIHGSPLHMSLLMPNIQAARLLLAYKDRINVNLANSYGQTALTLACQMGYLEIVQTLLSFPNINIDTVDVRQRSPLHAAIMENSDGIVKVLVNRQCNVNVEDSTGNTPLHQAVAKNTSTVEEIQ